MSSVIGADFTCNKATNLDLMGGLQRTHKTNKNKCQEAVTQRDFNSSGTARLFFCSPSQAAAAKSPGCMHMLAS